MSFGQRQACILILGLPSMTLGNLLGFPELQFPFLANGETTFSPYGCHKNNEIMYARSVTECLAHRRTSVKYIHC